MKYKTVKIKDIKSAIFIVRFKGNWWLKQHMFGVNSATKCSITFRPHDYVGVEINDCV